MRMSKRSRPAVFGAPDADPAPQAVAARLESNEQADEFAIETAPDAPLQPPRANLGLTAVEPRTPVRRADPAAGEPDMRAERYRPPSAWPIYMAAAGIAVLWALAPIAFAIGYRGGIEPLRNDAFALMVFGLLAVGPAAFVFGAAYMIRQGQKLAAEARRAKAMAEDMLAPALSAAISAGEVTRGVREEIIRASDAADEARESLLALREALAAETTLIVESTETSIRATRELTGTLGRERLEMGRLSQGLDIQATKVADSINQQAKMVAEASDLAETQLREAEAVLSARAADLAAAAGEASDAARTAGEDLTRHIARLETAGVGVSEQVRAVEGGLGEQRAALITLAQALKSDHATFTEEAEMHAATLGDFIAQARLSAAEMNDRAIQGGDSLRQLMAEAAEQFRDLAETARAEREEFGLSALQSLESVSDAAAEQRGQLETQTRAAIDALAAAADETRDAASRHAIAAREQVEQLSEAAFVAGQKANQVFETRLSEARALVEQASEMVDQAGAATAHKLEQGAAAARASLVELQTMMTQIEERAAQLPATARGQVELVRSTVDKGMDELMVQARRTAEEAQAIDAAFQDRVRRNFEMLSEAVRLMGVAAAGPPLAPSPPVAATPRPARARAEPADPPATPAPGPTPVEIPLQGKDDDLELDLNLDDLMEPAAPRDPVGAAAADALGLRPRLKLTPTVTDEAISAVFETPEGEAAEADGDAWTWKDLLASIDGADAEGERLQDILGAELTRMGVEPNKLLPKGRIDEIAAAMQTGDLDGAREVVQRLAPAATRRIARRLSTDEGLRRKTQVYVRRYQTLVDDAAVRDPEGFLMAALLGDDAGRLYLLLDAAASPA